MPRETARRIVIVGSTGSGKSHLAQALSARLGLEAIHADKVFWRPGWTDPDNDEFRADIARLTAAEAWVYDGNLGRVADLVLPRAQAVIWIEQPMLLCAFRAYVRTLRHLGRTRPDMADGCPEEFSLDLWNYVRGFNAKMRPQIESWLMKYSPNAPVVRLIGDRGVATFLADQK